MTPEYNINSELDQIIIDIDLKYSSSLKYQPPYTKKSLYASLIQNKNTYPQWNKINLNGNEIFNNLDTNQYQELESLIETNKYFAPFSLLVALRYAQKKNCASFDEFVPHLRYVLNYLKYRRHDRKSMKMKKNRFLCFTWNSETNDDDRYENRQKTGHKLANHSFMPSTMVFSDLHNVDSALCDTNNTGQDTTGNDNSGYTYSGMDSGGCDSGTADSGGGGGGDSGGGGGDSGGGGGGSCD